jgi:hypothetical protein
MRNFLQLARPDMGNQNLNLAPVQNALEQWGQTTQRNALMEQRQQEQAYQRGRDQLQDARQDEMFKIQNLERLGKSAFAFSQLAEDQRDPATWVRLVKGMQAYEPSIGTEPDDLDPIRGPAKFAAVYGGMVRDPREDRLMDLKLAQAQKDRAAPSGVGRLGMNPVYGLDEAGNVVVMQPSSTGELVQSKLPPGVRVTPGLVAGEKAEATARGKWEGGAEQRDVGKQRLSSQLREMARTYLELDKAGGIVNPDKGALENIRARIQSSETGQQIGGAVGSENQSIRRRIVNMQPLLLQGIMQATGMSARSLDSNRELQFYLQAASDPTSGDIYSNLVALDVLDRTFGLGGMLDETLPPEVLARVRTDSEQAMAARPIAPVPDAEPAPEPPAAATAEPSATVPPVPGARQAPDGNWYVADPNRPGKDLRVE